MKRPVLGLRRPFGSNPLANQGSNNNITPQDAPKPAAPQLQPAALQIPATDADKENPCAQSEDCGEPQLPASSAPTIPRPMGLMPRPAFRPAFPLRPLHTKPAALPAAPAAAAAVTAAAGQEEIEEEAVEVHYATVLYTKRDKYKKKHNRQFEDGILEVRPQGAATLYDMENKVRKPQTRRNFALALLKWMITQCNRPAGVPAIIPGSGGRRCTSPACLKLAL